MKHKWNQNCKNFTGIWPCDTSKYENYEDCSNCKYCENISKKIIILKLGAAGDVIRTTSIIEELKKKYGGDCFITWIVGEGNEIFLKGNSDIDRVLVFNLENFLRLQSEEFDVLLSLEIDVPATALANFIEAKDKFGFFLNKSGKPESFKESSDYYLERAYSDALNRNNKKTYPEMIFEICNLPYNKNKYAINLSNHSKKYALRFQNLLDVSKKTIGINIGSGGRFPSRMISKENIIQLVKILNTKYNIFILGGKNEEHLREEISQELKNLGINVLMNEINNSKEEFMGVVNLCDIVLTGDSMALHMAIGLNKKVVAFFFSTPPSEIEDYNLVSKLISPFCQDNLYLDYYSEELINSISCEEIYEEIKKLNLINSV